MRSKEIANQVNEVLRNDPVCGNDLWMACRPGVWPVGDPVQVRHAWFAGATPELSVAVFAGEAGAVDAGLPKAVWEMFLQKLRP